MKNELIEGKRNKIKFRTKQTRFEKKKFSNKKKVIIHKIQLFIDIIFFKIF